MLWRTRWLHGSEGARIAEAHFSAIYELWAADSTGRSPSVSGTRVGEIYDGMIGRHQNLLGHFESDLRRFLVQAPVKLESHETEYSWDFQRALDELTGKLLDGILAGRDSDERSVGFLLRTGNSESYSRKFLREEVQRRYKKKRAEPRPDFMETLAYARSLDGHAFEEWLVRVLRDAGITDVARTRTSRDGGADIVVELGSRRIVIQAKQKPEQTIGNDAVQEVYAARDLYNANEAWVVVTSNFSADASAAASKLGVRLVRGSQLLRLPDLIKGGGEDVKSEVGPSVNSVSPEVLVGAGAAAPKLAAASAQEETSSSSAVAAESVVRPTSAGGLKFQSAPDPPAVAHRPFLPTRARRYAALIYGAAFLVFLLGLLAAWDNWRSVRYRRLEAQRETGIVSLLTNWQRAAEAGDANALANCYASTVEVYFRDGRNVSRDFIRGDYQRQFSAFNKVRTVLIRNVHFIRAQRVTVSFDKEWDFRGSRDFSGYAQEEMAFVKEQGQWKIVYERATFVAREQGHP